MNWKVNYSASSREDLQSIFDYIAYGSRAVAALKKSYAIFSAVYAEEPDLLRTKQDEINAALARMGLPGLMPNRIESNS